jgi:hypothetical protein
MIRAAVKRLVRSIYVMRCGYCQVSEAEVGSELTYDHFQPASQGGSDDADNLVYACHACNEFKGDYFGDTEETRLLHPLRDNLKLHLRQAPDGTLQGITALGQRFINLLQLNRPPLVLYRLNAQQAEQSTKRYKAINDRLERIMARIQKIEAQIRFRRR